MARISKVLQRRVHGSFSRGRVSITTRDRLDDSTTSHNKISQGLGRRQKRAAEGGFLLPVHWRVDMPFSSLQVC